MSSQESLDSTFLSITQVLSVLFTSEWDEFVEKTYIVNLEDIEPHLSVGLQTDSNLYIFESQQSKGL